MTNSLLVLVTNSSSANLVNCYTVSSESGVFGTNGAVEHYLAVATNRDAGIAVSAAAAGVG